jgi:hypothetical protein
MHPAWGNQRHDVGKWFDTADGVGWGDGGLIELRRKDGIVVSGGMDIDEFFTGEDDVPIPSVTLRDGSIASFFDFKEWRYA